MELISEGILQKEANNQGVLLGLIKIHTRESTITICFTARERSNGRMGGCIADSGRTI